MKALAILLTTSFLIVLFWATKNYLRSVKKKGSYLKNIQRNLNKTEK